MWGCPKAIGADQLEEIRPPGWVDLGMEFSLIEPAGYPRDPAVTKAIRSFDHDMIPMTCRWVFLSPANEAGARYEKVFIRHAIGRYRYQPRLRVEHFPIEVPSGYDGDIPNVVDIILMDGPKSDPREVYNARDLPGPYEPWDWRLYYKLRANYWDGNVKTAIANHHSRIETNRKIAERKRADFEESMNKDFIPWAQRKLDEISESEALEWARRRANRANRSPR